MKLFTPLSIGLTAIAAGVVQADTPVFAHFMVQNSYGYNQTTWASEMTKAQNAGFTGFILNWVPPYCQAPPNDLNWQVNKINDAFVVAANQGFKLIYSFDMSYTNTSSNCPNGQAWTVSYMAQMINKYKGWYSHFSIDGDIVVSTYDGQLYPSSFFGDLKTELAKNSTTIRLSPALTPYSYASSDSSGYSGAQGQAKKLLAAYPAIDGFVNWQAWPFNSRNNLTGDADRGYRDYFQDNSKKGPVVMAISPWQYKDLNDGSSADSWVAYSDFLYYQRWQSAISDVKPDMIEVITWNDFPESHYISDLPGTSTSDPTYADLYEAPGSFYKYVNNHTHSAWRTMTKYYTNWLQTGNSTAKSDNLIFWYRRHPKLVACDGGNKQDPAVRNANFPNDIVAFWTILTSPANISVNVGSNSIQLINVPSGTPTVNQVAFPTNLGSGVVPSATILRNGKIIATATGALPISSSCDWEDYNPIVGLAGSGVL